MKRKSPTEPDALSPPEKRQKIDKALPGPPRQKVSRIAKVGKLFEG